MGDTSQVEAAVVTLLGGVFYPNGTGSPSAVGSAVNVERGWPTEADIRTATGSGMTLVRVHGIGGLAKDETRFPREWLDQAQPAISIGATISGFNVTFTGIAAVGQEIGLVTNLGGVSYVVESSDGLSSIVAALAALVVGASSSGAVLTLPNTVWTVQVNLVQSGPSMLEVAREWQMFQVATWAPSPGLRDSVMQLMFPALAYTYRLTLSDGSIATLMGIQASGPDDVPSRAKEWRRDLRATYDYPVTLVQNFPAVAVTVLGLTGNPAGETVDFYN